MQGKKCCLTQVMDETMQGLERMFYGDLRK